MINQTYQEVSKVIERDLMDLRIKMGFDTLGEVDKKISVQKYFFERKTRYPDKYERLTFDTNGPEPFSKDLSSIIQDFRVCGILKTKYDILPNLPE
jgi:hypothetical protein